MMNKTLYILLVIFLLQGCSILSKGSDDSALIAENEVDYVALELDTLLHTDVLIDSLALDSLAADSLLGLSADTALVVEPIILSDIFNIVPAQKVAYGDTLKLNLSDFILSNFNDIEIVDSKNFSIYISEGLIFISPIVNKNQLSSLKFNVNGQNTDIIVFSYATSYSDYNYKKNRNAALLKDTFEEVDGYLTLNYKYLASGSYDTDLKDNTNILLLDNQILDPKFYHIFTDGIRVMLPKNFNQSLLRVYSLDNYGVLLTQNETMFHDGSVLYPDQGIISPYFSNMYYILVDRFHGNKEDSTVATDLSIDRKVSFQGGDFSGISKKIGNGYFNRLGISDIMISPISSNPETSYRSNIPPYRKYMGFDGSWPIDSKSIDRRFGDVSDLESLINNSHQHGLGIHLDYILGTIHSKHQYAALHPNWITSNYSQHKSFLFNLDLSNKSVVQQISSDIIYWINSYNFDGIHYSFTEIQDNEFWNYLNKRIYSEVDRAEKIVGQNNSAYNLWLYSKGRDHFSGFNSNFKELNKHIKLNIKETGPINLLWTSTTTINGPKFISIADGHIGSEEADEHQIFVNYPQRINDKSSYDKLFMFHLMNNSLPGVPIIFQGDEYGQMGIGHSDSKRAIKFKKELNSAEFNLKNKVSHLNRIRLEHPSLSIGDFYVLKEGPDYTVWLKSYFNEHTIIFFNLQDQVITLNFPLPFESKSMVSLLDDQVINLDDPNMASIVIPPLKSGILLLDRK